MLTLNLITKNEIKKLCMCMQKIQENLQQQKQVSIMLVDI